jgi:hypothetical protein
MKQSISLAVLIAVVAIFLIKLNCHSDGVINIATYEKKIDSLQKKIDTIVKANDSLETSISLIEQKNDELEAEEDMLRQTILEILSDTSYKKETFNYTPTQVDAFFISRYPNEYAQITKDTTHLPIPVAKAAIVDIKTLDKTKLVLATTDSLVKVLDSTIINKDTIISNLRVKETNYLAIDKNRIEQNDNYKIVVSGLQLDNKKLKTSVRKQKLITYIAALIATALAVTHK